MARSQKVLVVFTFFASLVLVLLMTGPWWLQKLEKQVHFEIRVGSVYDLDLKLNANPAAIRVRWDYHVVRHLYGTLVRFDRKGQVQPYLASKLVIDGSTITFEFDSRLKDSAGNKLGARDAYFSLKRLLVLKKNTHGSLSQFLCGGHSISSFDDSCEGLKERGERLVLTLNSPSMIPHMVRMLANADFSIIPLAALDFNSLEITRWDITSGPFYVGRHDSPQKFEFARNQANPLITDTAVDRLKYRVYRANELKSKLLSGQVDVISTVSSGVIAPTVSETKQLSVYESLPIKLWKLTFTQRGMRTLSLANRRYIGLHARTLFLENLGRAYDIDPSFQMFPDLGDGSLDKPIEDEILQDTKMGAQPPQKKVSIAVSPSYYPDFKSISEKNETIEFMSIQQPPWTLAIEKQPHAFVASVDASFFEDYSLIAYQLSTHGMITPGEVTHESWLSSYLSEPEKNERLRRLREIHQHTLVNAVTVPFGYSRYKAFASRHFHLEFPPFFAGSPLWLVSKD